MASSTTSSSTDKGVSDPEAAAPASKKAAVEPTELTAAETGRTEGKNVRTLPFQDQFIVTVGERTDADGKLDKSSGTTYTLTPAGVDVPAEHVDEVLNIAAKHRTNLRLSKIKG